MNDGALFLAVFLACVVEAVEATTIVLAAGTARHFRSALVGVGAGILVLAIAVAIAGPAISLLPLGALRLLVGGLLLVFGLQWMRKSILRASGYKPLHDEDQIYHKQLVAAQNARSHSRFGVRDWYAFTLAFKGVVLEGLEVVFIVLTFGTNQRNLPLAALAAGVAVLLVVTLGTIVRAPLTRIPENTLKFIVGIMLTSFGVFWGAEGAGAVWPGADTALLVIVPVLAVFALLLVGMMRSRRRAARESHSTNPPSDAPTQHAQPAAAPFHVQNTAFSRLKAFGYFWYDFIVGDDWQIAAGVVLAFVIVFVLSTVSTSSWLVAPIAIATLLPYGIWHALRER